MAKAKKKIKILIIGGTGFLGYHLAERCLEKKWDITIFSLNKPKKKRFLKKIKYIRGDISKIKSLKKIDKFYNYIVNFGGYVNHINKKEVYRSHVLGCKNLTKIFLNKNIKLFLQISSGEEYGKLKSPHDENDFCKPKSIYGKAKNLATQYLLQKYKRNNFPCAILRLYQVFGKKQDLNRIIPFVIESCLFNKKFPCSSGKQFKDFINVEQVIAAILKTLKNKNVKGEIINIGSGKPIQIKKLIKMINNNIGKGEPNFGAIKSRNEENLKYFPRLRKANRLINWKPKNFFLKQLLNQINYQKKNIKLNE